ncbi:heterokaryon incompatibility protein-domain-containing protein [Poronia punctata]|nr:heterokaryon incompatibility protein-domain-containing protein [Poronia punctata]
MAWPLSLLGHPKYEYSGLSWEQRVFRVLKLLPPTRSLWPPFREVVNVEIIEISADDATGRYDSLSYCWGVGAANREVIVWLLADNDHARRYRVMRISASLEVALLSLSHAPDLGASLPIFADQICINQDDNAEKIQQVRLMGEIYSRCARTVVWLGSETPETRRWYDFSHQINSEAVLSRLMGPSVGHFRRVFDAVVDPGSVEMENAAQEEDRKDVFDIVTRYGPRFPLYGMMEILQRAWMNRLWTVQEGCLPSVVVFRCGERELCFDCFRAIILFYSILTSYWARHPDAPVPRSEVKVRSAIFALNTPFIRIFVERKKIHASPATKNGLYDLVRRYNVNDDTPKLGATKPEDRIYALLGIASDDEIARETMSGMEVDNVRSSYTKFAASVLKQDMDVLLFSQIPKSSVHGDHLPSWVPDWSAPQLGPPQGYSNLTTSLFTACGSRPNSDTCMDVDVATGILHVDAIHVGRVTHVGRSRIRSDPTSVSENVDFLSARCFFIELEAFMKMAALVNPTNAPDISGEQELRRAMTRISDGGLSAKIFPVTFDPSTAQTMLEEIHEKVSRFGEHLRRLDEDIKAKSSFVGMVRSTGLMPWYWTPASQIDVVRLCAVDPIMAARTWISGLLYTVADVVMVLWYSAKVRAYAFWIPFRRMRQKVDPGRPADDSALQRVGLSSEYIRKREWEYYTSNLLKNSGRRIFITDTGHVGLGPGHMNIGDTVTIIPGGSVPHALRPLGASKVTGQTSGEATGSEWSYIGGVYCDGIMDGELAHQTTTRYDIV